MVKVALVERVGTFPDVDKEVSTVLALLPHDDYSIGTGAISTYTDGRPNVSTERWCRLYFVAPFGSVTDMRFWVSSGLPNTGWSILYGLSNTFVKPHTGTSLIATQPVPTADPGTANLSPGPLNSQGVDGYSPWLVLQAVCNADALPGPLPSLGFTFSWIAT